MNNEYASCKEELRSSRVKCGKGMKTCGDCGQEKRRKKMYVDYVPISALEHRITNSLPGHEVGTQRVGRPTS